MDVEKHDEVLAHTSHLPHLMAFNLVEQLTNREDNLDIFRYAAGGFRDFSRIAASDPQMWHDIFFANRTAILKAVDGFEQQLAQLRQLIESEDSHALMGLLGHAQAARQHFNHMLAQKPFMEKNKVTQQFSILPGKNHFKVNLPFRVTNLCHIAPSCLVRLRKVPPMLQDFWKAKMH